MQSTMQVGRGSGTTQQSHPSSLRIAIPLQAARLGALMLDDGRAALLLCVENLQNKLDHKVRLGLVLRPNCCSESSVFSASLPLLEPCCKPDKSTESHNLAPKTMVDMLDLADFIEFYGVYQCLHSENEIVSKIASTSKAATILR
ncbi:hypothetical protein L1887_49852 [Cichorium endivia]|nr:hypothetical protein L1887_49852 [Cichorium endivia]